MLENDLILIIGAGVVITPLITEAVKMTLDSAKKLYATNIVVLIVSVVVALGLSLGFCIVNDISLNLKTATSIVAVIIINWLGAMLGYDKVKQAIGQIKGV